MERTFSPSFHCTGRMIIVFTDPYLLVSLIQHILDIVDTQHMHIYNAFILYFVQSMCSMRENIDHIQSTCEYYGDVEHIEKDIWWKDKSQVK